MLLFMLYTYTDARARAHGILQRGHSGSESRIVFARRVADRILGILFSLPSIFIIHEFTFSFPKGAFAKARCNGYATGRKPRESVYTQEDFNDLSSGIRRMTIDTRFHLDRSRRFELGCIRGVSRGHESSLRALVPLCFPVQSRFE